MPLMDHPEEDRFIRGIAASPEDEALRVVYADWLEEQGHAARSAYLRAEVKHFKSKRKKKSEKWSQVKGIDAVWANMVSRPPFGILRPGLTFHNEGRPPITRPDLAALERHWKTTLPPDYAAFLLLHNGGVPNKATLMAFAVDNEDYDEDEDAGGDSEVVGVFELDLRLFSLGDLAHRGKTAHWTSANGLCRGRAAKDEVLAHLMLIGTLTYLDETPPEVNWLFLDTRPDAVARYPQLCFTHDGKGLTAWDAESRYPSFIALLSDLYDT